MTRAAREREQNGGEGGWRHTVAAVGMQPAGQRVCARSPFPSLNKTVQTPLKQLTVSLYTTTHTRRSAVKNKPDESEGDEAQAHPLLTLLFELLWGSASYGRSDLPQALRAGN